ncbi:Bifunctional purine biosynthesis protein PurH [bioreactor metagenome]|uniref:Bifunctional purine biosynthesis protein PurH n=1 Tax=bioreactor metagenome TaxID=1076179 RepID=A0A645G014_9ZZZZ
MAVKHTNPCGISSAKTLYEAYLNAYNADPISIYGGILVTDGVMDAATAQKMGEIFLEVVVAPDYTPEALAILKEKKNIRLLKLNDIAYNGYAFETKKVLGGLLVQERDRKLCDELKVVTDRQPTNEETDDLLFAYKAVKNTKSNAVSLVKNKTLIASGPGQTNRIWALENAIRQSNSDTRGSVMASDAYFPFDDCVAAAAKAGITAIIQPGGSIRDADSIKLCNENNIAMIFTGVRHFKHS